MQIYLIYPFRDTAVEERIREFTSKVSNDRIDIFYFKSDEERPLWKIEARKQMKNSDLVVFFVGRQYFGNGSNVDFELRLSERYQKPIYYIPVDVDKNDIVGNRNTKKLFMDSRGTTVDGLIESIHRNYEYDLTSLLFPNGKDKDLSDDEKYILMDQYHTMMESSENLMTRRQETSGFYVSICTAMIGIFGVLGALGIDLLMLSAIMCGVSACGILLCVSWKASLNSYDRINYSKYNVMECMEKALPASMFFAEYKDTKNPFNGKVYQSYSKREKFIPVVFSFVYGIILMFAVSFILYSIYVNVF